MNYDNLITSFVEILQYVSLEQSLVDPDDSLGIICSEYVDALDFELAVACFESTHRVSLDYTELEDEAVEKMTITKLITDHLVEHSAELSDPLFVTKRFMMFKEALIDAIQEESENE